MIFILLAIVCVSAAIILTIRYFRTIKNGGSIVSETVAKRLLIGYILLFSIGTFLCGYGYFLFDYKGLS